MLIEHGGVNMVIVYGGAKTTEYDKRDCGLKLLNMIKEYGG